MGLTLGVIGIVLAVALIVVAIGMQLDERADIRTSLRRVGGYEVQDTRDRELPEALSERTFLPAIRSVGDFGRRVSPVGYLDSVKAKLLRSGQAERSDLDRFIVLKIAGVVLAPIAVFVILVVLNIEGLMGLLLAGVAAASLALGPDIVLDRKVERRVKAMRIALPEILDLLVISVEAGLGFEQALDRVVDNVPGPLTDEFARMLGEVRAGASRSEAMRAMEQRVDVQRRFGVEREREVARAHAELERLLERRRLVAAVAAAARAEHALGDARAQPQRHREERAAAVRAERVAVELEAAHLRP